MLRTKRPNKTVTAGDAMAARMTWSELCRSEKYTGMWVALDNCRYDQTTRQPIEGDVVDYDAELSELCARMREMGRCACTILFCEDDVFVQTPVPHEAERLSG